MALLKVLDMLVNSALDCPWPNSPLLLLPCSWYGKCTTGCASGLTSHKADMLGISSADHRSSLYRTLQGSLALPALLMPPTAPEPLTLLGQGTSSSTTLA